ncbi:hypothetical protein OUZ56_026087 [Daphnia magna]|uniref:Integrase p58-like C-terminal domain-containing protein n=1 Tax=Daphnia magna TaxID=35525 RepID=A0ABQ9ZKX2_9CRUS|nr:hypothetical protein OUZ56_026087 [Daphnia magna]
MHGRHPILPVDTIFGATPDPHQLVPVEAGGPDKYEIWMFGNLKRAFAEVYDRSQWTLRKYNQHYDTHHREGDKFHPTQQKSRTQRKTTPPLAQITPLNYEVQLNNSKKTKVVHVERLKSFVDLTQPAPNADGEAQSTDRVGSEGTINDVSKDGYTPVDPQQQPEGPAHPRKQLTEKKVRFTTPPKSRSNPPQKRTNPLPVRRPTRTDDTHYACAKNDLHWRRHSYTVWYYTGSTHIPGRDKSTSDLKNQPPGGRWH